MRSLRRSVRTWVLWALSFSVGMSVFVVHAIAHIANSPYSATYGSIDPRFLVNGIGIFALWTAQAGSILLALDVVHRDRREQIDEVLGAKAVSNWAVLAGRLAGIVLTAWLPLLMFGASLQFGAVLVGFLGWPASGLVQPTSVAAFLLIDSFPALIAWCSTIVLLAVALQNRLAVAIVAVLALGLHIWGLFHLPLYALPVVYGAANFANIASDVLPRFVDGPVLAQRLCLALLAAGLLLCAAAFYRRRDAVSRSPLVIAGSSLVVVGAASLTALFCSASQRIEERDRWTSAHAASRNDLRADLERVSGRIGIEPGERLELDLDLVLRTPTVSASPGALVFTFNPGLRVDQAKLNGLAVRHEHAFGFLNVRPVDPIPPGSTVLLSLEAVGVPDPRFAYLDSAVDPARHSIADSQLHVLGTEASIFERDYVALMPGIQWLPAPGANFEADNPSVPARDFFHIDIEVEVPRGWLVAGPGRRREVARVGGSTLFRFRPDAPVSAIGVFAARFEQRTTNVAGVDFELLLHPRHLANVEAAGTVGLAPVLESLVPASESDLAFPDDHLSIVEIPGQLRSYGGGWRMDTLQALPGVLLLREHGFPTARLEHR